MGYFANNNDKIEMPKAIFYPETYVCCIFSSLFAFKARKKTV